METIQQFSHLYAVRDYNTSLQIRDELRASSYNYETKFDIFMTELLIKSSKVHM